MSLYPFAFAAFNGVYSRDATCALALGSAPAASKRSTTDQMRLCHVHLATTKVMSSRCS